MKRKREYSFTKHSADQIANMANKNIQIGTDVTMEAMKHFRWKGERIQNVGYEQAKGNLFEYIENAKFVRNMANAGQGKLDKMPVTDLPAGRGGFGGHTAPDDFRIVKNGEIKFKAQAKVNNNIHDTAVNFTDKKYIDMQRITVSDKYKDALKELNEMVNRGEISKATYKEVLSHVRAGLTDDKTGISSGGTTTSELEQFRSKDGKININAIKNYARNFEFKQVSYEIGNSGIKGAASGAIMAGVISGVENLFEVYKNRKNLDEALKDTGLAVKESAKRGGIVGLTSAVLRYIGLKHNVQTVSNSNVATALAAGIVDCGVSIYAYTKGEITSEQLQKDLKNTVISTSSAYYFTEAIKITIGSGGGVFLPMAIYTVTSSMIMATKALIDQAKLTAQEYRRAAELLKEETKVLKRYRQQLNDEFKRYRKERKSAMDEFITNFDNSAFVTLNYSDAINSIVKLSDQLGYSLQHKEFKEFEDAMNRHETFVLK